MIESKYSSKYINRKNGSVTIQALDKIVTGFVNDLFGRFKQIHLVFEAVTSDGNNDTKDATIYFITGGVDLHSALFKIMIYMNRLPQNLTLYGIEIVNLISNDRKTANVRHLADIEPEYMAMIDKMITEHAIIQQNKLLKPDNES